MGKIFNTYETHYSRLNGRILGDDIFMNIHRNGHKCVVHICHEEEFSCWNFYVFWKNSKFAFIFLSRPIFPRKKCNFSIVELIDAENLKLRNWIPLFECTKQTIYSSGAIKIKVFPFSLVDQCQLAAVLEVQKGKNPKNATLKRHLKLPSDRKFPTTWLLCSRFYDIWCRKFQVVKMLFQTVMEIFRFKTLICTKFKWI